MALCPYCDQKVGWFEKAHESCVNIYRQKALEAEQARINRQRQEDLAQFQREVKNEMM